MWLCYFYQCYSAGAQDTTWVKKYTEYTMCCVYYIHM